MNNFEFASQWHPRNLRVGWKSAGSKSCKIFLTKAQRNISRMQIKDIFVLCLWFIGFWASLRLPEGALHENAAICCHFICFMFCDYKMIRCRCCLQNANKDIIESYFIHSCLTFIQYLHFFVAGLCCCCLNMVRSQYVDTHNTLFVNAARRHQPCPRQMPPSDPSRGRFWLNYLASILMKQSEINFLKSGGFRLIGAFSELLELTSEGVVNEGIKLQHLVWSHPLTWR